MVVKVRAHGLPKQYLFSIAGAVLIAGTGALMIRSALVKEKAAPCGDRYETATIFPLTDRAGRLITPIDIQARTGGTDWGVLANTRVVRAAGAPSPGLLEVDLPAGGRDGGTPRNPVSGAAFRWMPRVLETASSACLSYDVWLPEDFSFAPGGTLPGFFGGDPETAVREGRQHAFVAPLRWLPEGKLEARPQTVDFPAGEPMPVDETWLTLPRGRWFNVEQEVRLNTPGEADGLLRVWVDREMRLERKDVAYRASPTLKLSGVIANIHYGSLGQGWVPSPKSTAIRLSPLLVHWK